MIGFIKKLVDWLNGKHTDIEEEIEPSILHGKWNINGDYIIAKCIHDETGYEQEVTIKLNHALGKLESLFIKYVGNDTKFIKEEQNKDAIYKEAFGCRLEGVKYTCEREVKYALKKSDSNNPHLGTYVWKYQIEDMTPPLSQKEDGLILKDDGTCLYAIKYE